MQKRVYIFCNNLSLTERHDLEKVVFGSSFHIYKYVGDIFFNDFKTFARYVLRLYLDFQWLVIKYSLYQRQWILFRTMVF